MSKVHNWTIHDIARRAGVSAKTVSRVINDENGVSSSTRSRIAGIVAEVGFEPHMGARSMRSPRHDCVGVVLPAPPTEVPLSERFFIWLFNEMYQMFGTSGNFLCIDSHPPVRETGRDYARGLWQQRFAGCILCGPLSLTDTVVRRIHDSGHPYLAFGRLDGFPECSSATVNYELGARMSVEHLVKRGHKRIAMLKAFAGYQPGLERMRGYRAALEEAGLPFDPSLVRSVTVSQHNIINGVHRLLLDSDVTALVDCSAAEDPASIREGARRAGRIPGRDLDVVTWTYTANATVLPEACGHLWLPVVESAREGLLQFARWFAQKSDEPVSVLYRPTMYEHATGEQIQPSMPLFQVGT
jgi:DNA-binding LacI/PurR family transcriptional regulator